MSENAIVVENLSKRYRIGHRFSSGAQYKYMPLSIRRFPPLFSEHPNRHFREIERGGMPAIWYLTTPPRAAAAKLLIRFHLYQDDSSK